MEEQDKMLEADQSMPPVREDTKSFKVLSDLTRLNIISEENNEVLIEISGYDLRIDFNLPYLRGIEEVEVACEGIKELFKRTIMEQLLAHREQ